MSRNEPGLDPGATLAAIRTQAVALAAAGWPDLGTVADAILPDPLNPLALLPLAGGAAVGGDFSPLIPVAAAVVLLDAALRIVDDCADRDDPAALAEALGVGRAVHIALALQTVAARALDAPALPAAPLAALRDHYFHAFLQVCQGQVLDLGQPPATLAEYEASVRLKTVAAYEFAATVGARAAGADAAALARCAQCGRHLGWMAQLLDDLEALWFPVVAAAPGRETHTFPALLGRTLDHSNAAPVARLLQTPAPDRAQLCALLDGMDVRARLLTAALDHRDQALAALGDPLHPAGQGLVQLWLDWLLRDAARLLAAAP